MNENEEKYIASLLENPDIEFELESPNKQYVVCYSTRIVAKDIEKPSQFERTYWIDQEGAGGTLVEPWDAFDLIKQTTLAQNLIRFSHYSLRGVSMVGRSFAQNVGTRWKEKFGVIVQKIANQFLLQKAVIMSSPCLIRSVFSPLNSIRLKSMAI
jgi:hypothetical protein